VPSTITPCVYAIGTPTLCPHVFPFLPLDCPRFREQALSELLESVYGMMGLSFLASLRDTLSSATSWEAVEGALYCLLAVRNVVRTRLSSSDPTVSHQTHEVSRPSPLELSSKLLPPSPLRPCRLAPWPAGGVCQELSGRHLHVQEELGSSWVLQRCLNGLQDPSSPLRPSLPRQGCSQARPPLCAYQRALPAACTSLCPLGVLHRHVNGTFTHPSSLCSVMRRSCWPFLAT
jgi:hypothetical protein